MKKPFISILLVSILFHFLPLFSQQHLGRQTILQFDANHSVLRAPAPALEVATPMSHGRSSSVFLGGVGGVSFDQVAQPSGKLAISQLALQYDAGLEDDHRLNLVINDRPVRVYLPDWLLAPIARYADSPYYSCVTIFGALEDQELQQTLEENKGRVINYHPSFVNTLLGIRILYMDMLVGYEFTTDLPKDSLGSYLLGTGEDPPDVYANNEGAYYLSRYLNAAEDQFNDRFRSYVITDFSRKITFDLEHDSLVISGQPYYYCWKFNRDRQGYDIQEVADRIAGNYNDRIDQLGKEAGGNDARNYLSSQLIRLGKKYEGNYSFYQDGTFLEMLAVSSEEGKRDFLDQYDTESLFRMATQTEAYMDADSIVYLHEYSDYMSARPELYEAMNPAVWNATVTTMQFAAFFRFVKQNFPQEWKNFLTQVDKLDPEPRIITPTIMYDPDNKTLEPAVSKYKK